MLSRTETVARIVLDHSECAEVFHRHRIDFCCKGEMTLEAAATARGLVADALLEELRRAVAARTPVAELDPRALTTPQLIAHIISTHHAYLRTTLPFVDTLAIKVSRVHGDHNPKLVDVARVVAALVAALLPHLDEEEQGMFPAMMVRAPDTAALAPQIAAMWDDHRAVGALLDELRTATENYALPDWACKSYRTLFAELGQLEKDVLTHVHIENHVLAPRFA